MSETCQYCGEEISDPNDVASDQYMLEHHWIHECDEIPDEIRDRMNAPPAERMGDSDGRE